LPPNLTTTIDSKEDKIKIEELYKTYRGLMLHIAMQILKDRELAEDVLSDSIIKIIRHREKIFSLNCYQQQLYIVNIIKTTSLDLLKKLKNIKATDDAEDMLATTPDDNNIMLDELIAKEGYQTIKEIIKALPDSLKDVTYLYLICERSHGEIAEILGISISASKMRLTRAKKAMREAVTGDKNG
jgi:RNA polymerase sigma-70 factor (ECF subfamily)